MRRQAVVAVVLCIIAIGAVRAQAHPALTDRQQKIERDSIRAYQQATGDSSAGWGVREEWYEHMDTVANGRTIRYRTTEEPVYRDKKLLFMYWGLAFRNERGEWVPEWYRTSKEMLAAFDQRKNGK